MMSLGQLAEVEVARDSSLRHSAGRGRDSDFVSCKASCTEGFKVQRKVITATRLGLEGSRK